MPKLRAFLAAALLVLTGWGASAAPGLPDHKIAVLTTPPAMPLDGVAKPTVAYALNRLLTSYRGPVANIRRSSDNAQMDFYPLKNGDFPVANLAGFLAGSTGYVAKLYDQSGSGVDVSQSTAASQPQITLNGQGGRPVITFAGFHTLESSGNVTISGSVTHMTLSKFTTNVNADWDMTGSVGFGALGVGFTRQTFTQEDWNALDVLFAGNGVNGGQAPRAIAAKPTGGSDGNVHIWEAMLSASVASIIQDGVSQNLRVSSPATVPSVTNKVLIGAPTVIGSVAYNGTLGASLFWSGVVSGADREVVRNRLAQYYSVSLPVLPLDGISTPYAAYGLTKLLSSYSGPAVNVRRSSDNATKDIGFVGVDFDAATFSAFIGGGNGFVTRWYDQSGNGTDVTQGTASRQPRLVLNAINSKPALRFDQGASGPRLVAPSGGATNSGSSTFLNVASSETVSGWPYFSALEGSGAQQQAGWLGIQTAFNGAQVGDLLLFGNLWTGTGSAFNNPPVIVVQASSKLTDSQLHVWEGVAASTPEIRIDGAAPSVRSTQSGGAVLSTAQYPAIGGDATGGDAMTGYQTAVIFWNSALGQAERSTARTRLGRYFNVTVSP